MFTLITNNKDLLDNVSSGEFINGSSLDVLVCVRSLVHFGSKILTHPLCGNLRPNHQPFRSIIIDKTSGLVDLESLTLIEEAVHVYESCKLITPQELDEATCSDYAYIDSQLMRESLEQYRLINKNSDLTPAPLLLIK
ncbi:MAG: GrdX family protein [Synergistaceae bacterium]|nr:GrdX family protein [Synergistaceae bacterium]